MPHQRGTDSPNSPTRCACSSLQPGRVQIAAGPFKAIVERAQFLIDVGLDYLTLNRRVPTLSGGESQRIRLAAQLGAHLSGVLYVLDEPTIGLHPTDVDVLLAALDRLDDWPAKVRLMQANWIGKSRGLQTAFPLTNGPEGFLDVEVYTTRPDTLMGASFVGISPDHQLAKRLEADNPALKML